MIHELKVCEPYFSKIRIGQQPYDLRRNDRAFHNGDILILKQFKDGAFTGAAFRRRIVDVVCDRKYCGRGNVLLGLSEYGAGRARDEKFGQILDAVFAPN